MRKATRDRSRRWRTTSRCVDVTSKKSPYALYLRGFPNAPIENIRVIDCKFDNVAKGNVTEFVRGLDVTGTTINGVAAK